MRRRNHRQRLRGTQYAAHDPHGACGARAHHARRHLRERAALHRGSRSQPPLHHAFSRRALDPKLRIRLRRQCTAGEEVSRPAHRQLAGAHGRLAGGAHAHRRHRKSAGRDPLSGLRFPLRLRQDESGHADSARRLQGLESLDGRRRHRLAASGQGWPAVCHQSRIGILRRRARHQCQNQSQCLRHDSSRHHIHQCRAHCGQYALVGRIDRGQAGRRLAGPALRSCQWACGAAEFPFYRRGQAESQLFKAGRCPRRRADFGHRVRRPPPRARSARLSSPQLGTRRAGGRRGRLGNDGRRHGCGRGGCGAIPWP